jgi:hypothetical protein
MSTDVALLSVPAPRRTAPPTLIEVPALGRRPTRRPGARPAGATRRRRRRLRREIRVGGLAILMSGPLTWAALAVGRGELGIGPEAPRPEAAPVVRLSPDLEPELTAPGGDLAAPLVRPAGYLLPAGAGDPPEDAAHAGA